MLFSTITAKVNRFIAPKILKHGLTLRFVLSRGQIHKDTPLFDTFLLLPMAQTLLSIEIQDIAKEKRKEELQQKKPKSQLDEWVDGVWDNYIERFSPPQLNEDDNEAKDLMNASPRLRTFEKYIRPILTPTNEWSDVERWRFHSRFTKWLRSEYLICKYEDDIRDALASHSKLRVTPLLMSNQHWVKNAIEEYGMDFSGNEMTVNRKKGKFAPLPSGSILDQAFQLKRWNKTKSPSNEYQHMKEIATKLGGEVISIPGSTVQIASMPYETSIAELTLEEILEVTGCHVSSCGAFNALCDEVGIFEFWTEEYVQGLADYLVERCRRFDGETVVIDVGAGDGTLVHFLNAYMSEYVGASASKGTINKKGKKIDKGGRGRPGMNNRIPTIIATDNGDWKIHPKAHVERFSVTEAMKKYTPMDSGGKKGHQLIVICSWMPMGVDWTQTIRDYGADEYILIGECDDGNCGHNWLTFGNEHFLDVLGRADNSEKGSTGIMTAPYKVDGFDRFELEHLSLLQYSRFDSKVSGTSKTISFRKSDII